MMISVDDYESYKVSFMTYLIDKSRGSSSHKKKYRKLSNIIDDHDNAAGKGLQSIDEIQRNATVFKLLNKFIVKYNKNKLDGKYYNKVQTRCQPDDDGDDDGDGDGDIVEDAVTLTTIKKKKTKKEKKRKVSEEVYNNNDDRDAHDDANCVEKSKKSKRSKSSLSDTTSKVNVSYIVNKTRPSIDPRLLHQQEHQSMDHSNDVVVVNNQIENQSKVLEKVWPTPPSSGNITILLFYAYCPNGPMSRSQQDAAIAFCYGTLNKLGVTGRLRIAREGYNATLTGTYDSIRSFTSELRRYSKETFQHTDFKYVDNLPDNQLLKGLKVWPVTEIVTYGFDPKDAPLEKRGQHLAPKDFHEAMMDPNVVVIDVRNFNETVIGEFFLR